MTVRVAALALTGVFLAIYVPDVGHGFIKDDYAWIRNSRVADSGELLALFTRHVGFYRPLVAVSFAADHAVWGLTAWGYAATNLVLLLVDAVLLFGLARRFAVPAAAALLGAAVWVFNFHGVNMALLWISGRTSLLVTLFALAVAHAWLARRYILAGVLAFAAMLCKEEAVLLPPLFAAFTLVDPAATRVGLRGVLKPAAWALRPSAWPLLVALGMYLLLRAQSGAFGPTDAPSFYQFSFSPALLLRNVLEYLDRAATVGAVVALVLLAACRWHRAAPTTDERRALMFAVCWLPATYALTVFLPIRSSLYALLPSVATALAVAVVAARAGRSNPVLFRRAAAGLVVVTVLLLPVYGSRNQRWVQVADLTARVMETLRMRASNLEPGLIVLIDDPGERVNFDAALGSLFPEALELELGPGWNGAIVPASQSLPEPRVLTLALRDGRLVAVP